MGLGWGVYMEKLASSRTILQFCAFNDMYNEIQSQRKYGIELHTYLQQHYDILPSGFVFISTVLDPYK